MTSEHVDEELLTARDELDLWLAKHFSPIHPRGSWRVGYYAASNNSAAYSHSDDKWLRAQVRWYDGEGKINNYVRRRIAEKLNAVAAELDRRKMTYTIHEDSYGCKYLLVEVFEWNDDEPTSQPAPEPEPVAEPTAAPTSLHVVPATEVSTEEEAS